MEIKGDGHTSAGKGSCSPRSSNCGSFGPHDYFFKWSQFTNKTSRADK